MPIHAPGGASPRRSAARFALIACVLDSCWALQALRAVPRHTGSTVDLVSLGLWVALHLPAAFLAGLLLRTSPGPGLPPWMPPVLGGLGVLETFLLAYGWRRWRQRRA